MITQDTVLVQLIRLVKCIPSPKQPPRRPRTRPYLYSEKLFMKALVIMIVRRLHRLGELLAVLEEPTSEMRMCANSFVRRDASLPGVPSRGVLRLCPTRCRIRSAAWDATWWKYSSPGRVGAGR
jgi:hypothetical protein